MRGFVGWGFAAAALSLGLISIDRVAAPARAADIPPAMPVKALPPTVQFDWTGFYLGGYAGVGVNGSRGRDASGIVGAGGNIEHTGIGFVGGAALGYNWQFAPNWVAGVEGDLGYLGLGRNVIEYNSNLRYDLKTSWIATVRGRLGYSNGPTLSYVTGGAAWVHVEDLNSTLIAETVLTSARTRSGYAIGNGIETMLGGNWSAKTEYLYVDVGRGDTLANPSNAAVIQVDKHRYHIQKFGLNYRFGGKPQPPLPASNWSGFYLGIVGGGGVGQSRGVDPVQLLGSFYGEIGNNGQGVTAGGLAGYNVQLMPNWVAGVEGDFSYFGVNHSHGLLGSPSTILGVKTSWLATLRGRLGYSTGPALLYVTGGAAWMNIRDGWENAGANAPYVTTRKTSSGYTVGGGIEAALWGNWTTRGEYLYVDVGDGNTLVSDDTSMRVDHKFHIFRGGLTYRFGGNAVTARY